MNPVAGANPVILCLNNAKSSDSNQLLYFCDPSLPAHEGDGNTIINYQSIIHLFRDIVDYLEIEVIWCNAVEICRVLEEVPGRLYGGVQVLASLKNEHGIV